MIQLLTAIKIVFLWVGGFIGLALAIYIIARLVSFAVYKSRAQAYLTKEDDHE